MIEGVSRVTELIDMYNIAEAKRDYRKMMACDTAIKKIRKIEIDKEKRLQKLVEAEGEQNDDNE